MAELYYVIGASGAGKDSLLSYARDRLPLNAPVIFAHRYITRGVDLYGENHVSLSREEFTRRAERGCFAMRWQSHGNLYGVGIEIEQWLARGLNVVVNGSRAYLPQASSLYCELVPVLITAEYGLLRRRLQRRGRESDDEIEERLNLAQSFEEQLTHPRLQRIANNGRLEMAGEELLQLLQSGQAQACA